MKDKSVLDDLLFKPVMIKTQNQDRLVIIFGCETTVEQAINARGKRIKKTTDFVKLLDVSRSLEMSQPVLETLSVTNANRFKKFATIVPAKDHIAEILAVTTLIIGEATNLNQKIIDLSSAMTTIQALNQHDIEDQEQDDQANLVLVGQHQPWAHVVFKALTSDQDLTKALSPKDVENIGGAIMEIISDYVHLDLNNQEVIDRLKSEVEFKILNSLPDNLRVGDIHLNMDAIVGEIRRFQDHNNGSEGDNPNKDDAEEDDEE